MEGEGGQDEEAVWGGGGVMEEVEALDVADRWAPAPLPWGYCCCCCCCCWPNG